MGGGTGHGAATYLVVVQALSKAIRHPVSIGQGARVVGCNRIELPLSHQRGGILLVDLRFDGCCDLGLTLGDADLSLAVIVLKPPADAQAQRQEHAQGFKC